MHTQHKKLLLASSLVIASFFTRGSNAEAQTLDETSDWGHFESSMGFLVGQRSYEDSGLTLESANADIPPGALRGAPYDRTTVLGLRYDLRLVVSHVRMSAGINFPFASYSSADAIQVGATGTRVTESLKSYVLRFGIGGEYSFGPVTPFVDVLGAVHWIRTSIKYEGVSHEYAASDFGFSARAGLRLQVREWFFAGISAEVGIIGPVTWGTELFVGFALGPES